MAFCFVKCIHYERLSGSTYLISRMNVSFNLPKKKKKKKRKRKKKDEER